MMHTGKLDRFNTMNDVELKTMEPGLKCINLVNIFLSCLSFIHSFILFLLCFVFVYFSQCGINTKALFLLMFGHAVMMYFLPFNPDHVKTCVNVGS